MGSSLFLLAMMAFTVWGDRGLLAMWRTQYDLGRLAREIEIIEQKNATLGREVQRLRSDRGYIEKIAREPQSFWFGDWNQDVTADVDWRVSEIARAGALALLVAYDIPHRDCGNHSAGGASAGLTREAGRWPVPAMRTGGRTAPRLRLGGRVVLSTLRWTLAPTIVAS